MQLSAEITIRELARNGFWLEARIDESRRLKELIFSDASRVVYEYENSNLKKVKRIDPQGTELYSHTYNWENSQLQSQTGWFTTQYLYDHNGRVTARISPWQQEMISYNPQGEVTQIGHRTYSYDQSGQITREHGYFNASYDQNYNLKELSCNYDNRNNRVRESFICDEKNQLIEACSNHYFYDIYGRRTQKNDISYLHLGFEEIASFENGSCKTLKVPGIGGPIAIEIDGKPYAPVVDALGMIRKLIDPINNSIFAENDCDVFGGGLTDAIPYAYRGKRYDPETGLIYFGKRYYEPKWHRWLTPDPLGSVDHENLYQYVYNNPIRYSDPTGCNFWGYVLGIGEIIAGGSLMIAGGAVEIGSFGTLTLGVALAETSGAALIADGWTRAIHESKDVQLPKWDKKSETDFVSKQNTNEVIPKIKDGKQKDGTPKTNTAQNEQFSDAVKEIERKTGKKLSEKQWNKLHDRISGQNYGYHDIVEEGCWLLNE
jgi:RHS repeat-associated protein